MRGHWVASVALVIALAWIAGAAAAEKKYDSGVSDTEIEIGQSIPYSGPYSVYGQVGKAEQAYFAKINAEGGINGRKIRLISLDDGYLPAKALEQTRRLVEQDGVFLIFGSLGPATSMVVRRYLNPRKIPQLFVFAGDTAGGDYKHYPWTMNWGSSLAAEARLYAEHILENRPNAKIAILWLNDEYGRDYVRGFKDGLGARASIMIVGEQTYESMDPTVDSQILALRASGADTLFVASGGKFASQAYRKVYEIGWRPQIYTAVPGASPESILKPAGLQTVVGLITAYFAKSPEFRSVRDDPAMKDYFAWSKEWFPGGNAEDGIVAYGYQVSQGLEYVLRRCGDELTRANVMRVATHLDHVAFPMLWPGITATTSPTDYYPIKQFQMFRFDGKEWVPFGPIRGPE
jgi:ABC-type branched-subunit amino acid transport system substrate-binding protein